MVESRNASKDYHPHFVVLPKHEIFHVVQQITSEKRIEKKLISGKLVVENINPRAKYRTKTTNRARFVSYVHCGLYASKLI